MFTCKEVVSSLAGVGRIPAKAEYKIKEIKGRINYPAWLVYIKLEGKSHGRQFFSIINLD